MHFSASNTEPLICFRKPIYQVVAITTHMYSYIATITDDQIIPGLSVLKIAEAHVTLYILLIIIFRQPYCGSPRIVLKSLLPSLLLHLKILFTLSAHFSQIRLKNLLRSIVNGLKCLLSSAFIVIFCGSHFSWGFTFRNLWLDNIFSFLIRVTLA